MDIIRKGQFRLLSLSLRGLLLGILVFSCGSAQSRSLPEWAESGVIYEVNLRQFTEEGTFVSFMEHLPRLKEMGVKILWFMPIHPIGMTRRKGSLGSFYSVRDYRAVNPEFGTLTQWKALVDQAHAMGFKVLMDWVANHTAWDHPWILENPHWYTHVGGRIIPPNPDWSDVADLNFDNPELGEAMIGSMAYWVNEFDIDGFRLDAASMVPLEFWQRAVVELRSLKELLFLAEAEYSDYAGLFDLLYGWNFSRMAEIASESEQTSFLSHYIHSYHGVRPDPIQRMYFTSNHDQNSWEGTLRERFGSNWRNMAILSFSLPGVPMIYTGQETGVQKSLDFFEKDLVDWSRLSMEAFYRELIHWRASNPVLLEENKIKVMEESTESLLLLEVEQSQDSTAVVALNLGGSVVSLNPDLIAGRRALLKGAEVRNSEIVLEAGGGQIFVP